MGAFFADANRAYAWLIDLPEAKWYLIGTLLTGMALAAIAGPVTARGLHRLYRDYRRLRWTNPCSHCAEPTRYRARLASPGCEAGRPCCHGCWRSHVYDGRVAFTCPSCQDQMVVDWYLDKIAVSRCLTLDCPVDAFSLKGQLDYVYALGARDAWQDKGYGPLLDRIFSSRRMTI